MDFGSRIKQLRKELNITQTELAKKLNIGKTTISNYETNYSSPDNETLLKLSSIFEVSVDYLLGNTEIKNQHQEKTIEKFENENIDLWLSKTDGYKELPENDREKIIEYAKMMLDKHRIKKD